MFGLRRFDSNKKSINDKNKTDKTDRIHNYRVVNTFQMFISI